MTNPVPTPRPGCTPNGLLSSRFVVTLTTAGRTRWTTASTGLSPGGMRSGLDGAERGRRPKELPAGASARVIEQAGASAATTAVTARIRPITHPFAALLRIVGVYDRSI